MEAVSGIQVLPNDFCYATLVLLEEKQIFEKHLILFEEAFKSPTHCKISWQYRFSMNWII